MNKYDDLKKDIDKALTGAKADIANLGKVAKEAGRISATARDAHIIIDDIDRQFEEKTKLTKIDIGFLFLAIALQVARQYLVTNFKERKGDREAAKDSKKTEKKVFGRETNQERADRMNGAHPWYKPSLQEVMFNPVPFDITNGIEGLGGAFEHRAKTLGHDPILGYIFGTANIATATLTTWNLQSFHVKYAGDGVLRPTITNNADTVKVFESAIERLLDEGMEGKTIIAASLFREAMHLKSDINSKVSLSVPFAPLISPEFAKSLASYGFDMANIAVVGKQAAYAALINTIVAMIHRLMHENNGGGSLSLYEVRTRKILLWSNVIASASNLIAVALMARFGSPKKALEYLDIGGLLVTLYRIATDTQFMKKIKQEFLEKEFYNAVYGEEYDF